MRARGVPSPDEWDAVALTFAEPVRDRLQGFDRVRRGSVDGGAAIDSRTDGYGVRCARDDRVLSADRPGAD